MLRCHNYRRSEYSSPIDAFTAAYGLVTPFGAALGVGVRNTFQANDPTTILTIGILDSLSAGVLLYGALVNLIAKDFLAGQMLDVSNGRLSVALVSLFVGAALMSLREFLHDDLIITRRRSGSADTFLKSTLLCLNRPSVGQWA